MRNAIEFVGHTLPLVLAALAASAVPVVNAQASDLDLDVGFGSAGLVVADYTNAQGSYDIGFRAFRECNKTTGGQCQFPVGYHYWVAGYHNHYSTQDAIVSLVSDAGVPVPSFGSSGKLTVVTNLTRINDVAFDPATERLYFVGSEKFISTDTQFSVFCLDLTTAASCAGFGNTHSTGIDSEMVYFNLGGSDNDEATRVLFDPQGFLYVAGTADSASGYQLAVTKLSASTGAPISAFGNSGKASYEMGNAAPKLSVGVYGMALIPSSYQGISLDKLYLATAINNQYGNKVGLVVMLDAEGGGYIAGHAIYYVADDPVGGHGDDYLTAITVLANGELAVAGYSTTTTANQPALLIAKLHADSSLALDSNFCNGGICVKPVGANPHGWHNTYPIAIAERPENRDLVLGMQADTYNYNFSTSQYVLSQKQVVQQYGASGDVLHASTEILFPAFDAATLSVRSFGMAADDGSVVLVGSRGFTTSSLDYDVTVARLLANDSIFANQFGGAASD